MEAMEESIEKCRQCLLAGPAKEWVHRRLLLTHTLPSVLQGLPSQVERLCCTPMRRQAEVRRTVRFFAIAQDFVDMCLRSPLLGEGPLRMDLSPFLYVLRLIMSAEPVSPRFSEFDGTLAAGAAAAAPGTCHFNRDHGQPLVRMFDGHINHFWPDDEAALRRVRFLLLLFRTVV